MKLDTDNLLPALQEWRDKWVDAMNDWQDKGDKSIENYYLGHVRAMNVAISLLKHGGEKVVWHNRNY